MGPHLPRPDGDGRGDRPPGAPRRRVRVRRDQLPHGPVAAESAGGTRTPWPDSRTVVVPAPPTVDVVNAGPVRDPRPCGWCQQRGNARGGRAQYVRSSVRVSTPLWTALRAAHTTHRTNVVVVDLDPRRTEPARMADAKRQKWLAPNTPNTPAAPAAALPFNDALDGLDEARNAVGAALLGERIAAGAGQLAVGERQLAGLGERDEPCGARPEVRDGARGCRVAGPGFGFRWLDEQVQAVAVGMPAGRRGSDEGGRVRPVGGAPAFGTPACQGRASHRILANYSHKEAYRQSTGCRFPVRHHFRRGTPEDHPSRPRGAPDPRASSRERTVKRPSPYCHAACISTVQSVYEDLVLLRSSGPPPETSARRRGSER